MRRDRGYSRRQLLWAPPLGILSMVCLSAVALGRHDTVLLAISVALLILWVGRLVFVLRLPD